MSQIRYAGANGAPLYIGSLESGIPSLQLSGRPVDEHRQVEWHLLKRSPARCKNTAAAAFGTISGQCMDA